MPPPTIVIIEDDSDISEVIILVLSTVKGYHVKHFSSVEEVLENFPILIAMQPALIICDYELPDRSGFDLYDQVRAIPALSHVPVLLTTAYEKAVITHKIGKRQLQLIMKPFFMESFLHIVEQTIQTNPHEQTL